jgi:hypothetical protein
MINSLSGFKFSKIKDDEYISKRNMVFSIMSLLYSRLFLAQNYMSDNDKTIYSVIAKKLIEDVNDNLLFYNAFNYSGINNELSENINAMLMKHREKITELIKIIIFVLYKYFSQIHAKKRISFNNG